MYLTLMRKNGRGDRTRTYDLMLPKHARYQLRYTPIEVMVIGKCRGTVNSLYGNES